MPKLKSSISLLRQWHLCHRKLLLPVYVKTALIKPKGPVSGFCFVLFYFSIVKSSECIWTDVVFNHHNLVNMLHIWTYLEFLFCPCEKALLRMITMRLLVGYHREETSDHYFLMWHNVAVLSRATSSPSVLMTLHFGGCVFLLFTVYCQVNHDTVRTNGGICNLNTLIREEKQQA